MESRLRRDDGALIATLAAALDGDHDFMDGRLCALHYLLQFTLADGTVESIGYLCPDDNSAILRGDSPVWHGGVIQASPQFQEQFERLVNLP